MDRPTPRPWPCPDCKTIVAEGDHRCPKTGRLYQLSFSGDRINTYNQKVINGERVMERSEVSSFMEREGIWE